MYLLMNARKHGMKKIKKKTVSMLHDYSLFFFFFNWGLFSNIEVHCVLDLHMERTDSVLRLQRTATGDACCRWRSCTHSAILQAWLAFPHNSWKHRGLIFQTDMTKQVKFKWFALFSKIFDINICIPYQKWNIKYRLFFY